MVPTKFVPVIEKHLATYNLQTKAILMLDNAPSQKWWIKRWKYKSIVSASEHNITFSTNRPMHPWSVEEKLSWLLSHFESAINDIILDALWWVSEGWEEILPILLMHSWKILLYHNSSEKWEEVIKQCDIWVVTDNN